MKPVIESKKAWDLLLKYWNERDLVTPGERCVTRISFPDDNKTEQCVLHKSHTDGESLQANIPHVDADGNIARLVVSFETIQQARYLAENKD